MGVLPQETGGTATDLRIRLMETSQAVTTVPGARALKESPILLIHLVVEAGGGEVTMGTTMKKNDESGDGAYDGDVVAEFEESEDDEYDSSIVQLQADVLTIAKDRENATVGAHCTTSGC